MLSSKLVEKHEDPRVSRTHKLITRAFVDLMAEKMFQSITIQDIADRATVNRATFYAHFEDKFDLLDRYTHEGFQEWMDKKMTLREDLNLSQLKDLVTTVFEFIAEVETHCTSTTKQIEPLFESSIQEALADYLLNWFTQAAKQGIFLRQPATTVAHVWSWAIFGAGIRWSRESKAIPSNEMAAQVVDILTSPIES